MSVKFCHIAPTPFLESLTANNGAHLILAHLVESDPVYREFYANLDGKFKILDNSAFEKFKAGEPMYPTEKLIEMGKLCKADCIVMSDYPGERGQKTIDAAEATLSTYKDAGFSVFFVPQSEIGDLDDYMATMKWAIENDDIDLIGLSILGCPNAFGVEKDNKLQRFMSRWKILNILAEMYPVGSRDKLFNRFHCLGMVDGPNEIELLRPYHDWIYTWDSSAAVWAGLNNVRFDNTPTGLVNGKFEKEVDFDYIDDKLRNRNDDDLFHNMRVIDELCK
jgi:hypothetical protein